MSILTSIFGKFGKVMAAPGTASQTQTATALAAGTLGAFNPGLGALVEMIGNAIYSVEMASEGTAASGADKKAQVQHIIDVASPVTLQTLQAVTGKTLADPTSVAPALDSLIDDTVALFHAVGVFPPKLPHSDPLPASGGILSSLSPRTDHVGV